MRAATFYTDRYNLKLDLFHRNAHVDRTKHKDHEHAEAVIPFNIFTKLTDFLTKLTDPLLNQ